MKNQETKDLNYFEALTAEMNALFKNKQKDYGSAWKFHGLKGIVVRLGDKFLRLNNLVWEEKNPKNESVRDTLIDLAVYAIMGIISWEEERK